MGDELRQDRLVRALRPNPDDPPPNARRLVGYLGRSTTEGVWRLYLSPELDRYVEIPEQEILHHEEVAPGGGTAVWVRRQLRVTEVILQVSEVEAGFLSGAVASAAAERSTQGPGRYVNPYMCSVYASHPAPSLHSCRPPWTAGQECTQGGAGGCGFPTPECTANCTQGPCGYSEACTTWCNP